MIKKAVAPLPASYFRLVRQFPLTSIRDEEHLDTAQEMIDRLLEEDLDHGKQEYLDALTDLVETYKNEHYFLPDASEAEVLRELLRANDLTEPDLAKKTKISRTTLAAVLSGQRQLSRPQIVTLSRYFGVSAAAFLPE